MAGKFLIHSCVGRSLTFFFPLAVVMAAVVIVSALAITVSSIELLAHLAVADLAQEVHLSMAVVVITRSTMEVLVALLYPRILAVIEERSRVATTRRTGGATKLQAS